MCFCQQMLAFHIAFQRFYLLLFVQTAVGYKYVHQMIILINLGSQVIIDVIALHEHIWNRLCVCGNLRQIFKWMIRQNHVILANQLGVLSLHQTVRHLI